MKSRVTKQFRRSFSELPAQVQEQARSAFELFQQDAKHPSLQFKKVHATSPIYSARVSQGYRSVCILNDSGDWVWFFIGSHAEYDALLRSL